MATKKTAQTETKAPIKKASKVAAKKPVTKTAAASPAKKAAPKVAAAKPAKAAPAKSAAEEPKKKAPKAELEVAAKAVKTAAKKAPKKAAEPAEVDPDAASKAVALACAEAALDKKAVNVVILDVRGKVDYADYLVVMSGRSDRQVQALARGIAEDVQEKTKTRCISIESLPGSSWVLMDFGDVVVHVFYDDVRGYYDLESLWMDARRIPVPGAQDTN